MSQKIQDVSRRFFELRSSILQNGQIEIADLTSSQKLKLDKEFATYCKCLQPIILSNSMKILRDLDRAMENVTKVFTKIYYSKTYEWKEKSHLSYIYTISTNSAKMMKNKINRDKLVLESTLSAGDEISKESILDYLQNGTECQALNFELNYLHNNKELQFLKVVDIINSMKDADIIKDALGIKYDNGCDKWFVNDEDDMDYKDVAQKHGLNTAGAVKTKVFRAKKHIYAELTRDMKSHQIQDGELKTDGQISTFYKNGNIKMITSLLNGEYHGSFTKYNRNGHIIAIGTYENGKLNGAYKEFYTPDTNHDEDVVVGDGDCVKLSGIYEDGLKDGKWVRYWVDGSVMEEYEYMASYNNGEVEQVKFYEIHCGGKVISGIFGEDVLEDIDVDML